MDILHTVSARFGVFGEENVHLIGIFTEPGPAAQLMNDYTAAMAKAKHLPCPIEQSIPTEEWSPEQHLQYNEWYDITQLANSFSYAFIGEEPVNPTMESIGLAYLLINQPHQ